MYVLALQSCYWGAREDSRSLGAGKSKTKPLEDLGFKGYLGLSPVHTDEGRLSLGIRTEHMKGMEK